MVGRAQLNEGIDPGDSAEANLALLGVSVDQVMAELRFRQAKRAAEALRIQRKAAKEQGERRILRSAEGDGEVKFQVHPTFYHYWGQRLGYACWDDAGFVREFLRDNPETRIKTWSEKLTVGVQGLKGTGAAAAVAPAKARVVGRRGRWALA